jgi:hypothetical protein
MIFRLPGLQLLCALVATLGMAGCTDNSAPAPQDEAHHPGDGHDHGKEAGDNHAHDHDHEHGHDHAAGHPEEGPHHGHLIKLGEEEYHAELTHDDATQTITLYLLGADAKTAVAIADAEILLNLVTEGQPLQLKLAAAPQASDPTGESSRFTIIDAAGLASLEAPATTGRLNVTIADTPYSGTVQHHEHGDHDHQH